VRIGARSALAYMYVCIYFKQLRKLAGALLANERLASRGICSDADIMTAHYQFMITDIKSRMSYIWTMLMIIPVLN
jgi:hypothetical protein